MSNYCKVCFDAKKSKTVYTSHRVRNASGVVMCPTLLSQECNYCKKPGHTLSHCPALKGKYNNNKYQPEGKYNKPSPLRNEQKHEGNKRVEERNSDKRVEEHKNEERKNAERKNAERKKNEDDTRAEYYQRQDLQRRAAQLCRSPSPPPVDDFPIVGAKNGGPRFISAANTVSAANAAQAPLNQWASIVVKQAQQEQAQQDQAKQDQAQQQAKQQQQEQQQAKQHEEEDEDSSDDEQPQQAQQPQHRVVLSWADIE